LISICADDDVVVDSDNDGDGDGDPDLRHLNPYE
jgi:hypothetical protein